MRIPLAMAAALLLGAATALVAVPAAQADTPATIDVNASHLLAPLTNPSYAEDQGDLSPVLGPGDLANVAKLHTDVTRVWIKPDLYAPAGGGYDFDYDDQSTYDGDPNQPTGDHVLDYLDQAAKYSQRLLANFYRCPASLMTTPVTQAHLDACEQILQDGLMYYKQRYPSLQYIEAFNESEAAYGHTVIPESDYYKYFREFYLAVDAVNAALDPQIPLELGGPVTSSMGTDTFPGVPVSAQDYTAAFIADYQADTDTAHKRLDFISYHDYGSRTDPSASDAKVKFVTDTLAANHVAPQPKVFITEYGVFPGGNTGPIDFDTDLLTDASGMAALARDYSVGDGTGANRPDLAFEWVWDHQDNDRKSMFVDDADGKVYPYYNVVRMESMLKSSVVQATATPSVSGGTGLYVLGTADSTGVAVLTTNYQYTGGSATYSANVDVTNLPASFSGRQIMVQSYLVDATHSNYAYDPNASGLMAPAVQILPANSPVSIPVALGVNATSLVVLTPVAQGEAESASPTTSAGGTVGNVSDSGASGGSFSKFTGSATGDWVQYTVAPAPGTYQVWVRSKAGSTRGVFQASVNGGNVGAPHDYHAASDVFESSYLGDAVFPSGSSTVRFTLTTATGGTTLGIDAIRLIPVQNVAVEAEALTPYSSTADAWYYVADAAASGGAIVKADTNANGDTVQFTVNVPQAGDYVLKVGQKKADNRGIFQVSVDGAAVGSPVDAYSATAAYAAATLGTLHLDRAGDHTITLTITGKNSASSGRTLGIDYLTLLG